MPIHSQAVFRNLYLDGRKKNVEDQRVTDIATNCQNEGMGDWKMFIVPASLYSKARRLLAKMFVNSASFNA